MADSRIAYILWRCTRWDPSSGSKPEEHEFLEAGDDAEAVVTDANPEQEQIKDLLKDKGKELIMMYLVDEKRDAQLIFICASLSTEIMKVLLDSSTEQKGASMWTYSNA